MLELSIVISYKLRVFLTPYALHLILEGENLRCGSI